MKSRSTSLRTSKSNLKSRVEPHTLESCEAIMAASKRSFDSTVFQFGILTGMAIQNTQTRDGDVRDGMSRKRIKVRDGSYSSQHDLLLYTSSTGRCQGSSRRALNPFKASGQHAYEKSHFLQLYTVNYLVIVHLRTELDNMTFRYPRSQASRLNDRCVTLHRFRDAS